MSHNQSARRLNERQLREIAQIHAHVERKARFPTYAIRVASIARDLDICRHRVTRFVRGLHHDRRLGRIQHRDGTFLYHAVPFVRPPKRKPKPPKPPDPRLRGFTRVKHWVWVKGPYEIRKVHQMKMIMVDHSGRFSFPPITQPSFDAALALIAAAELDGIETG